MATALTPQPQTAQKKKPEDAWQQSHPGALHAPPPGGVGVVPPTQTIPLSATQPNVALRKSVDDVKSSLKSEADPSGALARAQGSFRANRLQPGATVSTLNTHLNFEGTLKYTGTVTIDCEFRGTVDSEDTLIIGPSAKVDAELKAGVIEIAGKVHGNVRARQRVKIFTGGEVHGNIETPTISMEEGVVFEGNCSRPPVTPPNDATQKSIAQTASDVQKMLARVDESLGSPAR